MSKYQVEMYVKNSGSPNDYPCSGAASECYLSIGYVSSANTNTAKVTTLFAKDIGNNRTYTKFLDTHQNRETNLVEIDDSTSTALILTFSIYWGNRTLDKILTSIAEKGLGIAFGGLYTDIAAGIVGDVLKEKLKAFEKRLTSKIQKDTGSFVDTIGIETVENFNLLVNGGKAVLEIRSDIDRQETFLDFPVITSGEQVAKVTLTKVDA